MRPTFRLVPDFIIPHLDKSTFGNHLQWENKQTGSFKISRIHQSSESWNEQCIEVYKAWSIHKNLWVVNDRKKITKAKHRLITALRRNPEIETLEKEQTYYRFRIIHNIADGRSNKLFREASNKIAEVPASKELKLDRVYSENISDRENFEMNNSGSAEEKTDFFPYNNSEITNLFHSPTYSLDIALHKQFPILAEDTFSDNLCNEESTSFSDRCCCDILLDNYLCNQKCIWHGMPP